MCNDVFVFICRTTKNPYVTIWQHIGMMLGRNAYSIRKNEENFVTVIDWLNEQDINYTVFVQDKELYTNILNTIMQTSIYLRLTETDFIYTKLAFPNLTNVFSSLPDAIYSGGTAEFH